jgi:hypothetical protein
MNSKHPALTRILTCGLAASLPTAALADSFGSGGNAFTIDFATVGNSGNANDTGGGGGSFSSPYGGVGYDYRIGVTEVPQSWIDKATALGLANVTAGAWTGFSGQQPAANITWYEAAAFVNWLNTSTGHQAAYNLTFSGSWTLSLWAASDAWQLDGQNLYRHKDAFYFLPSEDEWYKAAYHQNDGVTANYWDYPTGSNTLPTAVGTGTASGTAVFNTVVVAPAFVTTDGGLSSYGTRGQGGNIQELIESAFDGVNDSATENRVRRGGDWTDNGGSLRSDIRVSVLPGTETTTYGFRVASVVPEPATTGLLLAGIGAALARRPRRSSRARAGVVV